MVSPWIPEKWIFYESVRIYVYKAKESEVYATIDKLAVTSKTIFGSRGSTKRKVQKSYYGWSQIWFPKKYQKI